MTSYNLNPLPYSQVTFTATEHAELGQNAVPAAATVPGDMNTKDTDAVANPNTNPNTNHEVNTNIRINIKFSNTPSKATDLDSTIPYFNSGDIDEHLNNPHMDIKIDAVMDPEETDSESDADDDEIISGNRDFEGHHRYMRSKDYFNAMARAYQQRRDAKSVQDQKKMELGKEQQMGGTMDSGEGVEGMDKDEGLEAQTVEELMDWLDNELGWDSEKGYYEGLLSGA
ncbi:hypothetical protein BZA77DRAFT_354349 [Pyronema omphalodes]|nr:hypothetical protein BZA77DRAFT_354349 [Pyronema omphalodes]